MKYRPKRFDEVLGQSWPAKTLRSMVASSKVPTSLWFIGPVGTGKTSSARILAAALNCIHVNDGEPCGTCARCHDILNKGGRLGGPYIEVNVGGDGRMDKIRAELERTMYRHGRYMVLAFDEAHKMTSAVASLIQSTIEEPPEGVSFVLVSNEVAAITPATQDRCMRFDFKPISDDVIARHIEEVAKLEKIEVPPDLIVLIVREAQGSMRRALTRLEEASPDPQGFIESRTIDSAAKVDPKEIVKELQKLDRSLQERSAPPKRRDVWKTFMRRAIRMAKDGRITAMQSLDVPYALDRLARDSKVSDNTAKDAMEKLRSLDIVERLDAPGDAKWRLHPEQVI